MEDEAGSDIVENLLEKADQGSIEIFVSFMSFMAAVSPIFFGHVDLGGADFSEQADRVVALS